MGSNAQTFEVRVVVRKKGSMHFSSHVGMYIEENMTKMYHIDARTHEQAIRKAEKYGRPLGCRKVNTEKIMGDGLRLEAYGVNNPYPNAVAMDEMIWKRKNKRAERIESQEKDKENH